MINISSQNPNSTKSFRNKWIDGFTVSVINSTLTALTGAPNDFEQLTLKATLKRGNNEIEIFNHTLKLLVMMSHLTNNTYNYLRTNGQAYISMLNVTGDDRTMLVPLRFDFGGPINLVGDDELILEWTLNDGFFKTSSAVNLAGSYISLDETETTEVEYFTPITRSKVIEGSQDNPTYELGDNILQICLFNYDKLSFEVADSVVKNIAFKSDKVSKNDTYQELITKSISYYPTANEQATRYQNWILYRGGEELDGVSLNLSLNPANVTSSKNYLMTRSLLTSDWLVTRATAISDNLASKSDKKGSFNPNFLERDSI